MATSLSGTSLTATSLKMSLESHVESVLSTLEEDLKTLVKTVMESRERKLHLESVVSQWKSMEEYTGYVRSESQRSWKWFTLEMSQCLYAAAESIKNFLNRHNIHDQKVKVFHTDVEDEASTVVSVYFQTFHSNLINGTRQMWVQVDSSLLEQNVLDRVVSESPDRMSSVSHVWTDIRGRMEAHCLLRCSEIREKLMLLLKDVKPSVLKDDIDHAVDVLQTSLTQFNSEMEVKLPALCREVHKPRCQTMSLEQKATMLKDTGNFFVDLHWHKYMTAVNEAIKNVLESFGMYFTLETDKQPIGRRLEMWQRPEIGDVVGCFAKLCHALVCKMQHFKVCVQITINEYLARIETTNATLDSLHLKSCFEVLEPSSMLSETRSLLCELARTYMK